MLKIPFKDFPSFTERISLDGVPYRFRFRWNTRGEFWTMDIFSQDSTAIILGVKLVLDYELIANFAWMGLPPGELWAVDTTGSLLTIGRDDLPDGTVQLQYTPEADLVSI